jgi:hypothetical protein
MLRPVSRAGAESLDQNVAKSTPGIGRRCRRRVQEAGEKTADVCRRHGASSAT